MGFIKLHGNVNENLINVDNIILIEPFHGNTIHSKVYFIGLDKGIAYKETPEEIYAKINNFATIEV